LGKYQGLPPLLGEEKNKLSWRLNRRLRKSFMAGKENYSQAGKEILIMSVAQAIPVYMMSCFRLPDGLCTKINSIVSKFWWGQKKIHWKKWSNMCRKNLEGGMGFRDLVLFN
jgi:hypothetical protein